MPLPKQLIVMVFSQLVLSKLDTDDQIESQFNYQIVPDDQADITEDRYPETTPASQALLGHVNGDTVETTIDDQPVRLRIQGIQNG